MSLVVFAAIVVGGIWLIPAGLVGLQYLHEQRSQKHTPTGIQRIQAKVAAVVWATIPGVVMVAACVVGGT